MEVLKLRIFSQVHKYSYLLVGRATAETWLYAFYTLFRCSNNDQQIHVHMNLVATLAMAQVIFLAGIDTSQNQVIKSCFN